VERDHMETTRRWREDGGKIRGREKNKRTGEKITKSF
jgi:hypothetical protein